MGKLWVSAKIPGRKKQPASSVLSNEHIAILYPLCAVQRAQQGTAVSTDGMSRILSDASVFIPGASAYDRKIQFVVWGGFDCFAGTRGDGEDVWVV